MPRILETVPHEHFYTELYFYVPSFNGKRATPDNVTSEFTALIECPNRSPILYIRKTNAPLNIAESVTGQAMANQNALTDT